MNRKDKINKIMNLVADKSSSSDDKLDVFKEVLESLDSRTLNKIIAGIVFASAPLKKKKIWRIE
tara:strand:- start:670 stop:861 length:192 start_codon:yes stop_codon:yes gene_type:complete